MNEQIRNYINDQCCKQGLETQIKTSWGELVAGNEFATVKVLAGDMDEAYYFEYWNEEIRQELICRFLIPDSFTDFIGVCRLLKIFHSNQV